jgi:hypothetical protein
LIKGPWQEWLAVIGDGTSTQTSIAVTENIVAADAGGAQSLACIKPWKNKDGR